MTPRPVTIVGNPDGRRVALFGEALARRGWPPARVVAYRDLLGGRARLADAVEPGGVVRVESPDRDFEVERSLIAAGADAPDEDDPIEGGYAPRIGRAAAMALEFDRGRIWHPRQWALGFRALLGRIEAELAGGPPARWIGRPAEIAAMFDKPRCHDLFAAAGVERPESLGVPAGYDDLRDRMRRAGMARVFVKLASGSSASGIAALEVAGGRARATTTVEAVDGPGGELRLYNTRAIRRVGDERAVARLVDAICRERAIAERWVPKASLGGETFDLRVVVIAGRARHRVARAGPGPMTNLHLLNRRVDADAVRARMRPDDWAAALASAERAAGVVPGCLHVGVDVAIAAGFRRHAVLEINAFGDLLPGVLDDGLETYDAELAALGA